MSFQKDQQYREWVRRYNDAKDEAYARLRQARDRIDTQADNLRALRTEISADTTGQISQAHIDEVDAQITRFDGWVSAINSALAG